MWEYGKIPYAELQQQDVIIKVMEGLTLERPNECPDSVWKIMTSCFKKEVNIKISYSKLIIEQSKERPTFKALMVDLEKLIESPTSVQIEIEQPSVSSSKINYYTAQTDSKQTTKSYVLSPQIVQMGVQMSNKSYQSASSLSQNPSYGNVV
jgi:hypothetical protein